MGGGVEHSWNALTRKVGGRGKVYCTYMCCTALYLKTTVSHTRNSSENPQPLNNCGLGISIAVALCCLVIAPLSAAVGAVSACLIVRKQKRQKQRPLPEPPRSTEEVPDTCNLVYDYVSHEKIGTVRNKAYGQHNNTLMKIDGEELEKKLGNGEKLEAEEYMNPVPTEPL